MTSAARTPAVAPHLLSSVDTQITATVSEQQNSYRPRDVTATFNYFKDNADESYLIWEAGFHADASEYMFDCATAMVKSLLNSLP